MRANLAASAPLSAWTALALLLAGSGCSLGDMGSLDWTERTGGALSRGEKFSYVLAAVPELSNASWSWLVSSQPEKVALSELGPPQTPMVREAWRRLHLKSDPAFVNHSIRTAYWTVAVMKREKPDLAPAAVEEAWVAALLHDIGLAEPPEKGEFTLGGVAVLREIALQLGWSKESADRASEAITMNPNSSIDREKAGLLAWAMNVGGQGETFHGPHRILMNEENIRALEAQYPRLELPARASRILDVELARVPDQRFGVLRSIGFLWLMR